MNPITFLRSPLDLGVLFLCCISLSMGVARAESLSISVGELSDAIGTMDDEPDAISRLALLKIQAQLNSANLLLENGDILLSDSATNLATDSGCTRTEVRSLNTLLTLRSDSRLDFSFDSLNEPFTLSLALDLGVSATGRAKQIVGFRLGSCQDLGNDNFSFSARGDASIGLELVVLLNPTLDESGQRLVLRPEVVLTGELEKRNVAVDVDDSLLRSVLEDIIEDQIDSALDERELLSAVNDLEQKLSDALGKTLDSDGTLVVELPAPTDEQVSALYRTLSPEGDLMLSLGYVRSQRVALLAALLVGDDDAVSAIFSDAVQCEAAGVLQIKMPQPVVYAITDNGCEVAQIPDAETSEARQPTSANTWFEDAQCQITFDYMPTSTVDFCRTVLDNNRLGNADSRVEQLGRWTLSPGTRFDIGAVSLQGRIQPFTQRVKYKQIATPMGECALEMRIHSKGPLSGNAVSSSAPSRALIAFHGGSWQRRSSGALGIEAFAAQFVNEGFVVFAPFYRLIGTAEGTEACNDASLSEVLDDASDALTWVLANGARYGVDGNPVLFGQSAGGHLAGVLAVERAEEVESAVLFYAPTDFAEFARQLRDGEIETTTGQRILETVVDQTVDSLDLQAPLIQRNTLTARVATDVSAVPPFFILHGQRDTVLPVSQSIRFCNALAGNPDTGPASEMLANPTSTLQLVTRCGAYGSELHLIAEGEHALDLCVADELCLSGSPESADLTRDSVERMLRWVTTAGLDDDSSQNSNGGAAGILSLIMLLAVALYRRSVSELGLRPTLDS